jgi:hypothetical protein
LPCPVVSPGLLHALASPGRRCCRRSSGRQWHAHTVPRRHRWSARRGVRPRVSAPMLMSCISRWVRIFFPAPAPHDRSYGRCPHGRHWAYPPGSLGVASCLSPSLPRMLSYTPTRPTAAQAENPRSPLHRLAGDLRSHRLPSLGSSSLVRREHPHRCPGCSAQAAAGNPPSRKNRSTCGAAPLNLHLVVC